MSIFPGVIHGPLFYRNLENDKTNALRQNKGNYEAPIRLSQESVAELKLWWGNIDRADYPICTPNSKADITLYTDASSKGWDAVMGAKTTGGRSTETGTGNHSNYLELMVSFFRLKAFCSNMKSIHIRIYSDNTTAVNYINSMGGTHSMECNSVAKDIWLFCIERNIWLLQPLSQVKRISSQIQHQGFSMTIRNGCSDLTYFNKLQPFGENPL